MCIFYHFRCPLCRRFSSNETRSLCQERTSSKRKRCIKPVRINRWVGRDQFLEGWYCANRACDDSRVSQAVFESDIEDIIKSQKEGSARPPATQDPKNPINFSTLGSSADLQAFESSAINNRRDKQYLPRRTLQECQARLSYIRGIDKDRRLAARKVKVPADAEE